jgi:hypothetical protein
MGRLTTNYGYRYGGMELEEPRALLDVETTAPMAHAPVDRILSI